MTLILSLIVVIIVTAYGLGTVSGDLSRDGDRPSVYKPRTPSFTTRPLVTRQWEWGGTGGGGGQRVLGGGGLRYSRFMSIISGQQTCPSLQDMGWRLYRDSEYCDMVFDVNGGRRYDNETAVFCVHRAILAVRSDKLRKLITDALRDQPGVRRPVLKWPDMSPDIFKYLKQYVYTEQMENFDVQRQTIGLYVGAYLAGLSELTEIIEEYLSESDNHLEMLEDIIYYLRWSHSHREERLKEFLMNILRKIFRMSEREFFVFLEDLCEIRLTLGKGGDRDYDRDYVPLGDRNRDRDRDRESDRERDRDVDKDRDRNRNPIRSVSVDKAA